MLYAVVVALIALIVGGVLSLVLLYLAITPDDSERPDGPQLHQYN
jgi:hypothetical protein